MLSEARMGVRQAPQRLEGQKRFLPRGRRQTQTLRKLPTAQPSTKSQPNSQKSQAMVMGSRQVPRVPKTPPGALQWITHKGFKSSASALRNPEGVAGSKAPGGVFGTRGIRASPRPPQPLADQLRQVLHRQRAVVEH